MIFVTVGTSLPHDELIMTIDRLVRDGKISGEVIAQIGEGKYIPEYTEYIRFAPGLDEFYSRADIIISNCGAGTIMENVTKGHKLIVIQNPDITGGHEWELITKMEDGDHLIWCKDISQLANSIELASAKEFKRFQPKQLILSKLIEDIITSK